MKEQYKVVVMGTYGIGKTALVQRIISNRFLPTQSTIGSAFSVLKKGDLIIGLWDTAGNERYASLVPMYIRNANIVLLCVDSTEKFDTADVRQRINYIRENACDNTHIFIILTKCDDGEKVIKELDEFNSNVIIFTSAKTGYGIEELVETITKTVQSNAPLKTTFTVTPPRGGEWWNLLNWCS